MFEYKICSLEYFMNEMTQWEADLYISMVDRSVRNSWEMTRNIMWSNLAPMSKKRIKPKDIFEFSWEKPKQAQLPKQEVTQATVEKAMALAQKRKELLLKSGALN